MHGKVSDFPHRCNQCREAVSVDLLADPICCPKCGGNDIVSYAAKTKCASPWMLRLISNHWLAKLGYHTPTEEQHGDYCYPLDRHSAILWGKHPCPKCNAQGLQFSVQHPARRLEATTAATWGWVAPIDFSAFARAWLRDPLEFLCTPGGV